MRWINRERIKVDRVACPWLIRKYKLTDPALALLGGIVRAAHSHSSNPHPAGEGPRWVAFGFSALGLTDPEILDREFIVYDVLYAERKRRVGSPATA